MAPRLLSFLSQIQTALTEHGVAIASQPVQRSVSYHKGLARIVFNDGGAISLQNFILADGQMCVKAALLWAGCMDPVIHAIYPHGDAHDWRASAESIAMAWAAGPQSALPMPVRSPTTAPAESWVPASERAVAVS